MTDSLAKRLAQLPVKPEDLSRWILIGKVQLQAQIAAIKAIDKVTDSIVARRAALNDTQDLAEELLYAEARLGEMLEDMPDFHSSGKGTMKRKELPKGTDKKDSYYAQQLRRHANKIPEVVAQARIDGRIPVRRHVLAQIKWEAHVEHNKGESEWYTPQKYIEAARLVMGGIDCDPATTDEVNEQIKAKRYFTAETNGLNKKWGKRVWMNPPYKQPLVTEFCETFAAKLDEGEIQQGCVLINNITETDIGQELLLRCSVVSFPNGRIKFVNQSGNAIGAPLQGQMILYFGRNWESFIKHFSGFGVCLCRAR